MSATTIKTVGFPRISGLSRMQASSGYEGVRKHYQEYQNAWQADQESYYQLVEDWRMYFGWPGEQWSKEALKYKADNKQRAAQYNMIRPKVNLFHGSIIADEYQFKYVPIDRKRTSAIKAMEDAYYIDQEEMRYERHYNNAVLDGCVNLGILEVVVSVDKNPLGNIGFVRRDPTQIVFDPAWISDDDDDCKKAWKWGRLTAEQIEATWPDLPQSSKLDEELRRIKRIGQNWQERSMGDIPDPTTPMMNTFFVVQCHWIETVNSKRIIARGADGRWVPFPVTEDNELLEIFAERVGVQDWQNGAQVVPYTDNIHKMSVICPELFPTEVMTQGKPEVQIQRLPFLQFTCSRDLSGRNMGMVGPLKDPQLDINYSRSKILDLLATQQGGAILYDKNRMPDESDQQDWERNHNDTTRAFGVNGPVDGFMSHVSNSNVSGELMRELGQAFEVSDKVINVPAAMQAQTESAGEPASLFAMKLRQAKIGTRTVDDRVKDFRMKMALAYFMQARISYAGAERVMSSLDGKREAAFNVVLPDGSILNRIDIVPRCSVSIEEAAGNMSRQIRDREELSAVMKSLPPTYAEHAAITIGRLFQTTTVDEDTKSDLEEATEIERIKARIMSLSQIAATLAQQKNAELAVLSFQQKIDQLVAQLSNSVGGAQPGPGAGGELPLAISKPEEEAAPDVTRGQPRQGPTPGESAPQQPDVNQVAQNAEQRVAATVGA